MSSVDADRRALLLSGSLGMGHDVVAEACASSLSGRGWQCRTLDAMRLLGPGAGALGEQVFRGLLALPGAYDAFHFSQLRRGGRLARWTDAAASARLAPRLRAELADRPVRLVVSVFATGAAVAERLKREHPGLVSAVFCTDVGVHRLWVHEGTDLFLVTSETAACYVRRFRPEATVAVVPAPVRAAFYDPPPQREARAALGVPPDVPCVLLMSGAWGLGPLVGSAAALAAAGVRVLAVAGRNTVLAERLRALSARQPHVVPFGFTDRVPVLMAASDLVITASGDTCNEARVIGRDLLLLDVVPGHGRDNLQHELERGGAEVVSTDPATLVRAALAALSRVRRPATRVVGTPDGWEQAFTAALARVGLADTVPVPMPVP